ncbi:hypothetical protein AAIH32_11985 [Pseudarthrobacter oxydans]|uniref:hypothetical protein n=1 Tax=Pseudarthrobacter oxydans TaxID=1671 RepID=UPI003D2BB2E0
MNEISHRTALSMAALFLLVGIAGCSAGTATTPGSAPQQTSAVAAPVVQHKPAEVKKFLDAFLLTVSSESDGYMKAAMAGGVASGTDEEKAAKLKAAFPESYSYLALDEKKASGLIGIFALTAMLTPDTEMTANESGINIDGDTATIKASEIKIKGIEKSGQGGDNGKIGKITLTFQGTDWKITDLEIQQ